jgi:hypothetical protein
MLLFALQAYLLQSLTVIEAKRVKQWHLLSDIKIEENARNSY